MRNESKRKYGIFADFESFVRICKSSITEPGEYTVVSDQNGKPRRVMCYSTFELTNEEFEVAKTIMHETCKRVGHGYKALNVICEIIAFEMEKMVAASREDKARREALEEMKLQRAAARLMRNIQMLNA